MLIKRRKQNESESKAGPSKTQKRNSRLLSKPNRNPYIGRVGAFTMQKHYRVKVNVLENKEKVKKKNVIVDGTVEMAIEENVNFTKMNEKDLETQAWFQKQNQITDLIPSWIRI